MRAIILTLLVAPALSACSEAPMEEQAPDVVAEMEKQIEEDAKSLEEAADEAVKLLESEIDEELAAEGIEISEPTPDRTDKKVSNP